MKNDDGSYVINGEYISTYRADALRTMLRNDAYKVAGIFHGMDRSPKFRDSWPDEYAFAAANWRTFVDATRGLYTERLGDPKTPEHDAKQMFHAMVIDAEDQQGVEADTRLQLHPNTQQFVGDPYENKRIVRDFGADGMSLKELLLNTAGVRYH